MTTSCTYASLNFLFKKNSNRGCTAFTVFGYLSCIPFSFVFLLVDLIWCCCAIYNILFHKCLFSFEFCKLVKRPFRSPLRCQTSHLWCESFICGGTYFEEQIGLGLGKNPKWFFSDCILTWTNYTSCTVLLWVSKIQFCVSILQHICT